MVGIYCVVILVILIYVYFKNTYSYWSDKNVLALPIIPIVGSYGKFLKMDENSAIIYKNIYDNNKTELLVGGYKGFEPELIINDPDIIKMILVKDFNQFQNRGLRHDDEEELLTRHLFNMHGDKWRMMRQKLTPVFTSFKMRLMLPLILECGEVLQKRLSEIAMKENGIVEIKNIFSSFTIDTIGSCAFGLKMKTLTGENSEIKMTAVEIFKPSYKKMRLRFLQYVFPKLFNALLLRTRSREMENFFLNIVKQLVETRKGLEKRHDFIDLMIEMKENSKDFEITDEVITSQAFVFFAAGFETSSTTMCYALYELSFNKNKQKKLRKEISTILKTYGNQLTYNAIQDMKYLEAVVNETLRKYPPVPQIYRKCNTAQYTIPKTDVVINKGVHIVVPVYALHHDEKYFPEPQQFEPERFLNEVYPFSYLPFGEGPRNCIGLRFGKLQTLVGLISVLSQYSVEPCNKTPTHITIEPASVILMAKGGIWLKFTPSNPNQ